MAATWEIAVTAQARGCIVTGTRTDGEIVRTVTLETLLTEKAAVLADLLVAEDERRAKAEAATPAAQLAVAVTEAMPAAEAKRSA